MLHYFIDFEIPLDMTAFPIVFVYLWQIQGQSGGIQLVGLPQQRAPGKTGTVSSPSSVKPGSALPTTGQYLVSPTYNWSVKMILRQFIVATQNYKVRVFTT